MTERQTDGFEAFKAGKSLNDNPYGFRSGRTEWNEGWMLARKEFMSHQSVP